MIFNNCLWDRTFQMDQLSNLAPVLYALNSLFRVGLKNGYYHRRFRTQDKSKLAFWVLGDIYILLCLNCGLKMTPWFFTKVMNQVIHHLRSLGHRFFAWYLDDLFGSPPQTTHAHSTPRDTERLGVLVQNLFRKMAVYSVELPWEKLLRLSNHIDTKVLFHHYVDSLMLPTPVAGFCFDRFSQSNAARISDTVSGD